MNKIFFDTNILLDILIPDRPNHNLAIKALLKVGQKYDILSTSEDILTTIEYIATKNKISCEKIYSFFYKLEKNFEIYNFSKILEKSLEIYYKSCQNGNKLDFEDLLQIQCAIKNSCDVFLTEDRELSKMGFDIEILSLSEVS